MTPTDKGPSTEDKGLSKRDQAMTGEGAAGEEAQGDDTDDDRIDPPSMKDLGYSDKEIAEWKAQNWKRIPDYNLDGSPPDETMTRDGQPIPVGTDEESPSDEDAEGPTPQEIAEDKIRKPLEVEVGETAILAQEVYDGQEDPWAFLDRLASQAQEEGYEITAQEMLAQLEAQAEKEGEFSFDTMATSSIKNILTPGMRITIEAVLISEVAEEAVSDDDSVPPGEEDIRELAEDEEVDEPLADGNTEPGEEPAKKREANLAGLKEVFTSPEAQELDSYLVKIKESGQALMAELPNCQGGAESDKARQYRLDILTSLQAAEGLETSIKSTLEQDFGVSLRKELIPSFDILAAVKQGYEDGQVTMTEQSAIFDQVSAKGEKLSTVMEKAKEGA